MKTLIFVALLFCTTGLAAGKLSRKMHGTDLECHNRAVVQGWNSLCARSGCSVCGKFSYLGEEVYYTPSLCEDRFQADEAERRSLDEDAAIRLRYGPDAGSPDGGTDAGLTRELPRQDPIEVLG